MALHPGSSGVSSLGKAVVKIKCPTASQPYCLSSPSAPSPQHYPFHGGRSLGGDLCLLKMSSKYSRLAAPGWVAPSAACVAHTSRFTRRSPRPRKSCGRGAVNACLPGKSSHRERGVLVGCPSPALSARDALLRSSRELRGLRLRKAQLFQEAAAAPRALSGCRERAGGRGALQDSVVSEKLDFPGSEGQFGIVTEQNVGCIKCSEVKHHLEDWALGFVTQQTRNSNLANFQPDPRERIAPGLWGWR
nr:uncharacterized protein LOC105484940 [Macaca nemestrina]